MPSFESGTLYGFDRFIQKQNKYPSFFLESFNVVQPTEKEIVGLYQTRDWETLQSLTYQKWHTDAVFRAQPAPKVLPDSESANSSPQSSSSNSGTKFNPISG